MINPIDTSMTVEVLLAMLDSIGYRERACSQAGRQELENNAVLCLLIKTAGAMLVSLKFLGDLRGGFSLSSSNNDSPLEET